MLLLVACLLVAVYLPLLSSRSRPLGLAGQHHLPQRHQRPDVLPGVCHLAALAVGQCLRAPQIVAGTLGLYLTDSLYEPENEPPQAQQTRANEGTRLRRPLEPPGAAGDSDDERLPLTNTNTSIGCGASGFRVLCCHARH